MANVDLIAVPNLQWPFSVISSTSTPPGSPTVGDCYLVGGSPSGAWSGHANHIARWNSAGAWEFQTPTEGRSVWNVATDAWMQWNGSAWVNGNPLPAGGTTGQQLTKTSGTDYAVGWATLTGTGPTQIWFFANIGTLTNASGVIGDIAIVGGTIDNLYFKNASNVWELGGPLNGSGGDITSVTAGTALTGGGTSGAVTLNVSFGTSSTTACVGNDSRLSDSRVPSGSAGGDLGGTYPNPTVTTSAALKSATTNVVTSAATAPTAGQVLTATSTTAADWQTPAAASTTVKDAGTTVGTRGAINLIEGSNITITTADNSGADRVDITIASSGGGSSSPFLDTPSSPHADNDEFTGWSGWTVRDITAGANLTDDGDGPVHPWSFPASGHYRRKTIGSQIILQFPNSTNSIIIYKAITVASNMLLWSRFAGTSGLLSGTVDANTTAQVHFGLYTDSGGLPVTTNQLVVEQTSLSGGGRKLGYLEGATRVQSSQIINQGVRMIDIMGFMHLSSTSFVPFAVDSASGDVHIYTSSAITAASATRAYIGYRVISGGSSTYCPSVTLDFVRRKDSASAWVI